ncbi:MAG: sugar kinase [Pseudorhodoplanes sp.]|nr:MAG: sugar kinase [Pseudorhodoplanes sp.]
MTGQRKRIVSVGEVMIEMARGSDGRFALGCGGDTFNTAVYLARAGLDVAYASALGDDPYSDAILALAGAEGMATDLIVRVPGRLPGLYLIETDAAGERAFYYWRDHAPARELFELGEWSRLAGSIMSARLVYFSGITLSIYSNQGLGRFLALLEMARQQGIKVAFDGNYRPRSWKGDIQRTRTVFMEALKRVDIALPTFDDEALLWGDTSPETTVERLQSFGIAEIAVKNGHNPALVAAGGVRDFVAVPDVVKPVDTTAAGDSFNAGYLAARLGGDNPAGAALAGHRLAAEVIQQRGAIIPRTSAAVH